MILASAMTDHWQHHITDLGKSLRDFFTWPVLRLVLLSIIGPVVFWFLVFVYAWYDLASWFNALMLKWLIPLEWVDLAWVFDAVLIALAVGLVWFTIMVMLALVADSVVNIVNQRHYQVAVKGNNRLWPMIQVYVTTFARFFFWLIVTLPLWLVPVVNLMLPVVLSGILFRVPVLHTILAALATAEEQALAMKKLRWPSRFRAWLSVLGLGLPGINLFIPVLSMIYLSHLSIKYLQHARGDKQNSEETNDFVNHNDRNDAFPQEDSFNLLDR